VRHSQRRRWHPGTRFRRKGGASLFFAAVCNAIRDFGRRASFESDNTSPEDECLEHNSACRRERRAPMAASTRSRKFSILSAKGALSFAAPKGEAIAVVTLR
jgi:hypothetical protein